MTDLSALSNDEIMSAAGLNNPISNAILNQESGNNPNSPTSVNGAVGRAQIIPSTFKQYAKPGEDINNPDDNLAVHQRIIEDLTQKAGGDPARVAVGYFSGPGNIAPPDSPTPYKQDHVDGNGKSVSSYVSDVLKRLPEKQYADSGEIKTDTPVDTNPLSKISDEELLKIVNPANADPKKPGYGEDIVNSIAYRGLPEGIAAATNVGMASNIVRGVSDLTRWAGGKVYQGLTGEELPHYTQNPIPTSSDILKFAANQAGKELYEPKTVPGQYANTISQFAAGGAGLGVPIRNSVASAVASEAAGQATQGTDYEPAARALAALYSPRGINARGAPEVIPSSEVRANASQLFQKADQEGGVVPAKATDAWVDKSSKAIPQTAAGKLVLGETPTTQLISRIEGLKGKPLSLAEAQEIDSGLGQLAQKEVDPKTGKYTKEGAQLIGIQSHLRDIIDTLPDQGFATLKEAKGEWAKSARLSDLERIHENALNTDNPSSSIRTGYRNLMKNKAAFNRFNADEQAAIAKAAKTGIVTSLLRTGGNRVTAPIIGGIAGSFSGPIGAMVGAGLGELAAIPLKSAATASQMGKANNALATVASRGAAPIQSPLMQLLKNDLSVKPTVRVPVRTARNNP